MTDNAATVARLENRCPKCGWQDLGCPLDHRSVREQRDRRERIATEALKGLTMSNVRFEILPAIAKRLADRLIAELDRVDPVVCSAPCSACLAVAGERHALGCKNGKEWP